MVAINSTTMPCVPGNSYTLFIIHTYIFSLRPLVTGVFVCYAFAMLIMANFPTTERQIYLNNMIHGKALIQIGQVYLMLYFKIIMIITGPVYNANTA